WPRDGALLFLLVFLAGLFAALRGGAGSGWGADGRRPFADGWLLRAWASGAFARGRRNAGTFYAAPLGAGHSFRARLSRYFRGTRASFSCGTLSRFQGPRARSGFGAGRRHCPRSARRPAGPLSGSAIPLRGRGARSGGGRPGDRRAVELRLRRQGSWWLRLLL